MKLLDNWKQVHKHSWSVKLNYAVAFFGSVNLFLATFQTQVHAFFDQLSTGGVPVNMGVVNGFDFILAVAIPTTALAANIARLIQQQTLTNPPSN